MHPSFPTHAIAAGALAYFELPSLLEGGPLDGKTLTPELLGHGLPGKHPLPITGVLVWRQDHGATPGYQSIFVCVECASERARIVREARPEVDIHSYARDPARESLTRGPFFTEIALCRGRARSAS